MRATSVSARPPQARVIRNEGRLLDAATAALAENGWPGLTFAGVAQRAGLSRRTLQDRFSDVTEVSVAVWLTRVNAPLVAAMEQVLRAGGLLDAPADVSDFARALSAFHRPTPELRAAAELLLLSQFHEPLADAVASTAGTSVREWCTPVARRVTRPQAARRAYVLGVALGLLLVERRPGSGKVDLSTEARRMMAALGEDAAPVALPRSVARHIDRPTRFDSGDPTLDALLQAVLDEVGVRGFDGTSVDRIAKAAGFSQGALFARYDTKLDLFVDAAERQVALALRSNADYLADIEARYGPGISDAVGIREFQRPGREHLRALTLEHVRLSWHEARLTASLNREVDEFIRMASANFDGGADEARAYFHVGYALGTGVLALAILDPDCWKLPYDVVSVPLANAR